jgi:tetratricopeptide (TPR) repeat protein
MAESPSVDDLCRRARAHLKAGEAREALALFEEARLLNDLDPDIHEGIAEAHCRLKEFEPAARHFDAVTRLDPRRSASWINLGAVYNRLGNHQKAAEVLRRGVQVNRKSCIGFYNLGIAYRHLKQWSLAIPAYREAIRLDPKMADAYLNLGNVYLEMGNLPQAAAQFRKALEISPDLERARRGLEKADDKLRAARSAESPFGRLVNPDSVGGTDVVAPGRELSDSERQHDRAELFEMLTQTETDLKELLDCLGDKLDPAVRTLNRLLTHGESPHGVGQTKSEALESYRQALAAFEPRLLQFRRILKQQRDHEARLK